MSLGCCMTSAGKPSGPSASEALNYAPWFHNVHLPDGTQTAPHHPLGDFPRFKWEQVQPHLPASLDGWKVLDLGCNGGFYAIEAARRGALVTAVDADTHFLGQARWVADKFGLARRIEFRHASIYDLARWDEEYDLIFFLGLFYHLRHPLLALDLVSTCVRRLVVFQTLTIPGDTDHGTPADLDLDHRTRLAQPDWPKMAFVENALAGDSTNWWVPNPACIEAMLRSAGLKVRVRPGHEIYLCEPDSNADGGRLSRTAELRSATGMGAFEGEKGKAL